MKKQTKNAQEKKVYSGDIKVNRPKIPEGLEELYAEFVTRLTGRIAQDIADEFALVLNDIDAALTETLDAKFSKKSAAKKSAKKPTAKKEAK